jgi:hypothetical protein
MGRMAHEQQRRQVDNAGVESTQQMQIQLQPAHAEELRIQGWRLEQFRDLGFGLARAALMAEDTGIDLAQARRLIALGCPLDTAARILL